jgi:hypothetical protein
MFHAAVGANETIAMEGRNSGTISYLILVTLWFTVLLED